MTSAPIHFFHVRNALTYISVLTGLLAIVLSIVLKSWEIAGSMIAISVIADIFDGRFARLFPSSEKQKALGAQLDSLADAVVFGIAPITCIFLLISPINLGAEFFILVIAAFIYLIGALTRLAVFNIHANDSYFIGFPTTIAGLICATVFFFHPSIAVLSFVLFALAFAMILPITLNRPKGWRMALLIAWPALLALHVIW